MHQIKKLKDENLKLVKSYDDQAKQFEKDLNALISKADVIETQELKEALNLLANKQKTMTNTFTEIKSKNAEIFENLPDEYTDITDQLLKKFYESESYKDISLTGILTKEDIDTIQLKIYEELPTQFPIRINKIDFEKIINNNNRIVPTDNAYEYHQFEFMIMRILEGYPLNLNETSLIPYFHSYVTNVIISFAKICYDLDFHYVRNLKFVDSSSEEPIFHSYVKPDVLILDSNNQLVFVIEEKGFDKDISDAEYAIETKLNEKFRSKLPYPVFCSYYNDEELSIGILYRHPDPGSKGVFLETFNTKYLLTDVNDRIKIMAHLINVVGIINTFYEQVTVFCDNS